MQRIIFGVVFAIYIIFALWYSKDALANGDEVHYLLTTYSIVHDKDIWLENNYSAGNQLQFNPGAVDQIAVKGLDGHTYPVHGIGFSFLIAPAFAIGGKSMVSVFLAVCSFVLFILTVVLIQKLTGLKIIALIITTALFLSTPLFNFSILSFTEMIGALVFVFTLYTIIVSKRQSLLVILALSLLIWIHIRFLVPAVMLFGLWFFEVSAKRKIYYSLIFILSLLIYFVFIKSVFGSFDPMAPYKLLGELPQTGNIFTNILNLFIDRQYGLFVYCPLFLFAVPGIFIWYRKSKRSLLYIGAISLAYLLPIFSKGTWQGYTPPARFLVPILPFLIIGVVFFFTKRRNILTVLIAMFLYIWGFANTIIGIFFTVNHGFIYEDGISTNLMFISGKLGINLHDFFPAYYPKRSLSLAHYIWVVVLFIFWRFI